MQFYAIKQEWESSEKVLLKLKKMFFGSRILTKIRANRYAVKKPSKRSVREKAIVSAAYRSANDY